MENKEQKIIEHYLAGYGQQNCAKFARVSTRTVKKVLEKNNIHIRSKSEAGIERSKSGRGLQSTLDYTPEQEALVLDLYVKQKRGQNYCCQKAKCNVKILKEILHNNGVKIRNFSEAASISNINRAKYKDKDYFNHQSPNMAWILGFLASDGNVSKDDNTIKISLSSIDVEILEKIKEEIQIENSIQTYTSSKGFTYSSLSWCCQEHKQALAKYSIVPNKTFILKPPYQLDRKYWIDYIRGYFDGDGSINLIKNSNGRGNGNLRWQVCSATKEILEFIENFYYEEYSISKPTILVRNPSAENEHNLYYIQYSSKATREIYKHLYTPNSLFLARKKKHYEEILKQVKSLDDIVSHETTIP